MKKIKSLTYIVLVLYISSCTSTADREPVSTDPLPSWNEGETKKSIKQYVEDVTDPNSDHFIEIADRIAVFDNDGTLWSEKPAYFQLLFAIDRVKALAPMHPEWNDEQPFRAVLENDMEELIKSGEHGLLKIVMATHAGTTTDEFEEIVKDWLSIARHPTYERPYTDLVYQPMLELLKYLQSHDFKTFIVSGGGIEFMRPWVEEVYKIPRNQVVGSSIKTEFEVIDGKPVIKRLADIDFIDDKEGKPIGIHKFIGRRPVFCAGNSDGDLAMMQWTAAGNGARFMLYVHHTDAEREWAYDHDSSIGRLDKGLDEALKNGWTTVDMKEDWNVIYPFQKSSH